MRFHGNFLDSGVPQLFARQRSAFGERAQLRPRNLWMHPPAETAVGSGDHVFAADEIGKGEDAIGYQPGVLDDVGRMAHHATNTIGGMSIRNLSPISNSIQEKTSAPGQLRRYVCKTFARFVWYPVTFRPRLRSVADASPATRPLRGMEAWAGVRCAFVLPKT